MKFTTVAALLLAATSAVVFAANPNPQPQVQQPQVQQPQGQQPQGQQPQGQQPNQNQGQQPQGQQPNQNQAIVDPNAQPKVDNPPATPAYATCVRIAAALARTKTSEKMTGWLGCMPEFHAIITKIDENKRKDFIAKVLKAVSTADIPWTAKTFEEVRKDGAVKDNKNITDDMWNKLMAARNADPAKKDALSYEADEKVYKYAAVFMTNKKEKQEAAVKALDVRQTECAADEKAEKCTKADKAFRDSLDGSSSKIAAGSLAAIAAVLAIAALF